MTVNLSSWCSLLMTQHHASLLVGYATGKRYTQVGAGPWAGKVEWDGWNDVGWEAERQKNVWGSLTAWQLIVDRIGQYCTFMSAFFGLDRARYDRKTRSLWANVSQWQKPCFFK